MRTYQPSWEQLKQSKSKSITIAAHAKLHRRIYKAVIKEKDMDLVYKLELQAEGKIAKLSRTSTGHSLKIQLHISIPTKNFETYLT